MNRAFPASYDSTAKVLSIAVSVVLLGVVAATRSVVAGGVAALILATAYAYSPRGYAVAERSVIVRRLMGNVRIPLDSIREIRAATADDFQGCIRLFGNGGLFGYYGLFRTSKLGKCTWYVTNRGNAVVVITGEKTVVFSPDEVDGFIEAIRGRAPVRMTPPGEPVRDAGIGKPIGALIGAGIGIAALTAGAFAALYAPGPPGYTLTRASLTIHDRFYPVSVDASSVDAGGIRVVDLDVDTAWRPIERTNGFANTHYRAGWFRVAGGGKVRLYQADGRRLVLLPPKGDGVAVLLETAEPEKFVAEVREKWS